MQAVEFLPLNNELRSYARFFKDHTGCTGITWKVQRAERIKAGQVMGEFTFVNEPPVEIIAPIDAQVVLTYSPDVADLPHRPSVPIVLLRPEAAGP